VRASGRPGLVRAWASLRARPSAALVTALGLFLVGLMVGAAVTLGWSLSTGFERAQRAANAPEVTARFDVIEREDALSRLSGLANVEETSFRLVIRGVEMGARVTEGERPRFGRAEVNGVEPGSTDAGLAIVRGRGLSGAPGEVVIERGLADDWGIGPGTPIGMGTGRDWWFGTVVGVSVEPDIVAFPLASEPRVYVAYDEVFTQIYTSGGTRPVNAAYLRLANADRLAETLVQARTASFGLTGTTFATRSATQAIVNEAGGLVVALLGAFAVIALVAAGAMLASTGHARVTRDLPTIGVLRTLGFTPLRLAGSYALEAAISAAPAAGLGIVAGGLLVAGPTDDLLRALNELGPAGAIGPPHLAAFALVLVVAAAAAGWPAFAATRQAVVGSLSGAARTPPRRTMAVTGPLALGARLAVRRPGRFLVSVFAVAAALATILLLLAVGRFLISVQEEPAALGERYSLIVEGGDDDAALVRATPGVAAAVARYEVRALDAFDLQEPIRIVAFGRGKDQVFAGRPLLSGRRAKALGETEVGAGLAQSLGLDIGGVLIAQVENGAELRLNVTGIVQELADDGRVAYTDVAALLAARPDLPPGIAVRSRAGVSVASLQEALEQQGLTVTTNSGIAPNGAPFLTTIVALLRIVAVVNGLVCAALVLLALVVLARERSETIGVLRTSGGSQRDVWSLLFGAGASLVLTALTVAYALERFVFGPTLSGMVERYGELPLAPNVVDVVVVGLAGVLVAALTAAVAGRRYVNEPVVRLLRPQ
jgi:ABC-type antimicrobial peptide transport system permease subunit